MKMFLSYILGLYLLIEPIHGNAQQCDKNDFDANSHECQKNFKDFLEHLQADVNLTNELFVEEKCCAFVRAETCLVTGADASGCQDKKKEIEDLLNGFKSEVDVKKYCLNFDNRKCVEKKDLRLNGTTNEENCRLEELQKRTTECSNISKQAKYNAGEERDEVKRKTMLCCAMKELGSCMSEAAIKSNCVKMVEGMEMIENASMNMTFNATCMNFDSSVCKSNSAEVNVGMLSLVLVVLVFLILNC
ncbi:uncharacterized protein LOC106458015 [Limulus polyphemus]|uniref:Uncharacterized protein LOC106458015 n=1 Tax=Limulus polyphemus TaxID=6850 RepID=A0ABM1S885_LIMPO|nr:uncharacterized protein LOC106458015 [Limulus polyphemus]